MLLYIIKREFQQNLLSLRLYISYFLMLLLFGIGTIAFIKNNEANIQNYIKYQTEFTTELKKDAESNLSDFATRRQNLIIKPRENAFISDSKEKLLPTRFEYSAFNVFGFDMPGGSSNPYLNTFQELNWAFIVSIIISFMVMLFTFDSISGEKELKTLTLSLSNSLSRGMLLSGKYLSTILTIAFMLLSGIALSMIIFLISGTVAVTSIMLGEIVGFIFAGLIFAGCIAAFGLLSSVLTRNTNVSLLLALIMWLVFVVLIPNSAIFWTNTLFPIEKAEAIEKKITQERDDIFKNAPPGSNSARSNDPFYPKHELRAELYTKLMDSEMRIRNEFYNERFRQLEQSRLVTYLSPQSLFEYLCEAVVGGGYLRFQKTWKDLHAYQTQLLTFFKAKDAADPDSPHWYDPQWGISTTRKPVKFEEVPLFQEKIISFGERLVFAKTYLLVMVLFTAVVFFLTYILFVRYDVR